MSTTNQQETNTPIINQYKSIKKLHKDKILLFHLGDFYEMFYEDAELVSKTLGLTLTYRKNGKEQVYMCGIPVANKDFYIKKLLKESFKVVICQQVETPEMCKARGGTLVAREVTAIYTSGTYVDEDSYENNYILVLKSSFKKELHEENKDNKSLFVCYFDMGTEDFFYEKIYIKDLKNLLCRINPKEIIFEEEEKLFLGNYEELVTYLKIDISNYEKIYRDELNNNFNISRNILYDNFGPSKKIEEFLNRESLEFVFILELLFLYLRSTYNSPPVLAPFISDNSIETSLDKYTIENLDLFNEKASLYILLNKNFTPMGKRLLKKILIKPLTKKENINKRLETVNFFNYHLLGKTQLYFNLKEQLRSIGDANKILFFVKERILNNRNTGKITSNILNIFLRSLESGEKIIILLRNNGDLPLLLTEMVYDYKFMSEYKKLLNVFKKGDNFFKEDFLTTIYKEFNLNTILKEIQNHQDYIKNIVANSKLSNNTIIGYFFETTNKDKDLIYANNEFIVRQTLLNNIRFTTKKLIELESALKLLEVKRQEISEEILNNFLKDILQEENNIKKLMEIISYLDVFLSFSHVATENNFFKPKIIEKEENSQQILSYENGRHPIIENLKNNFIKNHLNMVEKKITFITGPNMGGKSTFMRTTALIILMAQIGSYVPAENCILTPFNNIFVRIGYNDDPLEGESTFYKEMKECSEILNKCNNKSTIVFLDEICRGTSYEDGILLSKGIMEYLLDRKVLGLISSHYLELGNFLKDKHEAYVNILYTTYKYENEKLKFLYKMEEGIIDNSFGIKVAEMAGLPKEILKKIYLMKNSK